MCLVVLHLALGPDLGLRLADMAVDIFARRIVENHLVESTVVIGLDDIFTLSGEEGAGQASKKIRV